MKKKNPEPQVAADNQGQELEEMTNRYKRVLADYHNLEKRTANQASERALYSAEVLLDKLIPVWENLNRAGEHLKDQGVQMITKQFKETLESEGLEIIETNNAEFDPETMDCVELVEGPKNKVIKTLSPGYRLYDKVLRAAKVAVGSGETDIKKD